MSRAIVERTKEEAVLLAVSVTAAGVVIASVREAAPPSTGLWLATAAALGLALTGLFAFWFGGAARRRFAESRQAEWDATRSLLSAIPDGLLVLHDGRISSVNRGLCEMLGYERSELLHATVPYPFWPPEHRHEIETWHDELADRGEAVAELTLRHSRGDRIRMLASGRLVPGDPGGVRHVVTVRDVSATHRRERRLTELATRDSETGLLDRREFEERLGGAVRRAIHAGTSVTVVLAELAVYGRAGGGVFGRPEALLAVDRLRRLLRAGDDFARTGDSELAWILSETDVAGGVEAIGRWRAELADVHGVELTAGLCDLASGADAFSLYALADRALSTARRRGPGSTEAHAPSVGPTASDDTLRI
jgi:PAS domain S-box-containing protein